MILLKLPKKLKNKELIFPILIQLKKLNWEMEELSKEISIFLKNKSKNKLINLKMMKKLLKKKFPMLKNKSTNLLKNKLLLYLNSILLKNIEWRN
jgi:hypothetical protein